MLFYYIVDLPGGHAGSFFNPQTVSTEVTDFGDLLDYYTYTDINESFKIYYHPTITSEQYFLPAFSDDDEINIKLSDETFIKYAKPYYTLGEKDNSYITSTTPKGAPIIITDYTGTQTNNWDTTATGYARRLYHQWVGSATPAYNRTVNKKTWFPYFISTLDEYEDDTGLFFKTPTYLRKFNKEKIIDVPFFSYKFVEVVKPSGVEWSPGATIYYNPDTKLYSTYGVTKNIFGMCLNYYAASELLAHVIKFNSSKFSVPAAETSGLGPILKKYKLDPIKYLSNTQPGTAAAVFTGDWGYTYNNGVDGGRIVKLNPPSTEELVRISHANVPLVGDYGQYTNSYYITYRSFNPIYGAYGDLLKGTEKTHRLFLRRFMLPDNVYSHDLCWAATNRFTESAGDWSTVAPKEAKVVQVNSKTYLVKQESYYPLTENNLKRPNIADDGTSSRLITNKIFLNGGGSCYYAWREGHRDLGGGFYNTRYCSKIYNIRYGDDFDYLDDDKILADPVLHKSYLHSEGHDQRTFKFYFKVPYSSSVNRCEIRLLGLYYDTTLGIWAFRNVYPWMNCTLENVPTSGRGYATWTFEMNTADYPSLHTDGGKTRRFLIQARAIRVRDDNQAETSIGVTLFATDVTPDWTHQYPYSVMQGPDDTYDTIIGKVPTACVEKVGPTFETLHGTSTVSCISGSNDDFEITVETSKWWELPNTEEAHEEWEFASSLPITSNFYSHEANKKYLYITTDNGYYWNNQNGFWDFGNKAKVIDIWLDSNRTRWILSSYKVPFIDGMTKLWITIKHVVTMKDMKFSNRYDTATIEYHEKWEYDVPTGTLTKIQDNTSTLNTNLI